MDALPLSPCEEVGREGAEGVEKWKCFLRLSGGREVNQLTKRREKGSRHGRAWDAVGGLGSVPWAPSGTKQREWGELFNRTPIASTANSKCDDDEQTAED